MSDYQEFEPIPNTGGNLEVYFRKGNPVRQFLITQQASFVRSVFVDVNNIDELISRLQQVKEELNNA